MGLVTGIVVYFMIWWTVLFTVLPFGIRPTKSGPDQAMPGAPENPQLRKKFAITTAISAVLWLVIYLLIRADIVDLFELARIMHEQDPQ